MEKKLEIQKTDTSSVKQVEEVVATIETEKKTEEVKTENNSGTIQINGKSDGANPFQYDNVVNGDTIQSITIKGNADFIIKNNYRKEETVKKEETVSENLNFVAKVARTAVAQSTIKEVATEIKSVQKNTESNGFVFPVYLFGFLILLFIVLLWFLWNKFGAGLLDRFNRRR